MTALGDLAGIEDEQQLFGLVKRERLARDSGRWEELAGCYWPDGTVRVTWFTGSPGE